MKRPRLERASGKPKLRFELKLFVEITGRAGNINPSRNATLAILDPLDDASWLLALGAVRALGGVHFFFAVGGFGNLSHAAFKLLMSLG